MNAYFRRSSPCGWMVVVLATTLSLVASAQERPPDVGSLDKEGNPAGFHTLAIGEQAPDFSLPGIDGRMYTLSSFSQADVVMVLFTSNHCPTSHGIEKRLQKLRADFRDRSFSLVAINPNHPDGLNIAELGFGEYTDSFEDMKPYAEQNGWDFPYLYDGESQSTARAYGCLATPHVFIFDKQRRLRYAGRFDDSRFPQEETVMSSDARKALEDLFAGRPVAVPLTKPHGCSTKWREKRAMHIATEESWKQIPVFVERADAKGVEALRNNPGPNYRLINIWAGWCEPCLAEMPQLVSISRQFDMRNFELITLSLDDPAGHKQTSDTLQRYGAGLTPRKRAQIEKEGRTTSHYIFSGGNQEELANAVDREWPGPLPHTILVAPGGQIIWRHNGPIDPATARVQIVKALTPYWPNNDASKQ